MRQDGYTRAARRAALIASVKEAEAAIRAAVKADYPDLFGYLCRSPMLRQVPTGPGPDDWRWPRPGELRLRDLRAYAGRAWAYAASRISESYGLGAGSGWLARHGHAASLGAEAQASVQVLASLTQIARHKP